jgi:excisionase family DNA binding protein
MPDSLLTIPEAAEALSLSRGSIYNLMKAGKLPTIKIGASRRIESSAIERLLNEARETDRIRSMPLGSAYVGPPTCEPDEDEAAS